MEKVEDESCPPPPPPAPTRLFITKDETEKLSKDDILKRFRDNEKYIDDLERRYDQNKNSEEKLKLQQESARKENVLLMRLATKEQEMQDLLTQNQELKQSQRPSTTQLQNMLLDPAVNLLFEKMKSELTATKEKLEQAQNDLSAWKFTPDSVTGKKLMAKCRMLIKENQDLGKQLSQGRIAQLEAELALQKKFSEELKGTQDEMNEFVIQLDEEVEGMQATICTLQQQLKDSTSRNSLLEEENQRLLQRIYQLNPDEKLKNDSSELLGTSDNLAPTNRTSTSDVFISNHHPNGIKTEIKTEELDEQMDVDTNIESHQNDDITRTSVVQSTYTTNENSNESETYNKTHLQQQQTSPSSYPTKTAFSITNLLSSENNDSAPLRKDAVIGISSEPAENGSVNGAVVEVSPSS